MFTKFSCLDTKQQMETAMADIKTNANRVRNKLKVIEKNIKDSPNISQADMRIRKTQVVCCMVLRCGLES